MEGDQDAYLLYGALKPHTSSIAVQLIIQRAPPHHTIADPGEPGQVDLLRAHTLQDAMISCCQLPSRPIPATPQRPRVISLGLGDMPKHPHSRNRGGGQLHMCNVRDPEAPILADIVYQAARHFQSAVEIGAKPLKLQAA